MFPKLIIAFLISILVFSIAKKIRARMARIKKEISGRKIERCDYCGVYVPFGEAIKRDGGVFCSDDHVGRRAK